MLARLPKTGYLSPAMAKVAAQNIAAAITGTADVRHPRPRLLDLQLIDGGDTGLLRLAVRLPGGAAHRLKGLLTRYLLWKLRTGRSSLP
jgi:hypothetical protein